MRRNVLAAVLNGLPDKVKVYPTENYFSFHPGDRKTEKPADQPAQQP